VNYPITIISLHLNAFVCAQTVLKNPKPHITQLASFSTFHVQKIWNVLWRILLYNKKIQEQKFRPVTNGR